MIELKANGCCIAIEVSEETTTLKFTGPPWAGGETLVMPTPLFAHQLAQLKIPKDAASKAGPFLRAAAAAEKQREDLLLQNMSEDGRKKRAALGARRAARVKEAKAPAPALVPAPVS